MVELAATNEVDDLWAAITSGRVSYTTYADLLVALARPLGSMAEVSGDAGTHEDPVSNEIVPNDGVYRRVEEGWEWLRGMPAEMQFQRREIVALAGQDEFDFLNPPVAGTITVYHDGLRLASTDYTVAGSTVTLDNPAGAGDVVVLESYVDTVPVVPVAGDISYTSLGGVGTSVQDKLAEIPSLKGDFGAVGDGVTDDTAAVQAFVDYLCDNHVIGFAPMGNYLLSAKINFACTYGWGILGAGQDATIFTQSADNVPIFDLGIIPDTFMHGWILADMQLNYSNVQDAADTAANCLFFSAMGYHGVLRSIRFMRGSYAIKVANGIAAPWGQHWDDLRFESGLTLGAVDYSNTFGNVPNVCWGRIAVDALNMAGPIFKQMKGYNWTWQTCEILRVTNAAWIDFQTLADCRIGALKAEISTYDAAFTNNALIYMPQGSLIIGALVLRGATTVLNPPGASYVFHGDVDRLRVDICDVSPTVASTNFYLSNCTVGQVEIGKYRTKTAFSIPYVNIGASTSAAYMTVYPDKNDQVSGDVGDVNYVITQGGPGVIMFETALTAARTCDLPVDAAKMFNGLKYRIISNGAVNAGNTLTIQGAGVAKAVLRGAYQYVDMEWRRSASSPGTPHAGWTVVGSGSIRPGAAPVVPTANLPAAAAAMDGVVLIEDAGAGDRNLIIYAGGQRFRIDGGAAV